MSRWRVVAVLLAVVLSAAVTSALSSPAQSLAAAPEAGSGSAMTKSGGTQFPDLKVTVSQTTNLINQTVVISWTGGATTLPDTGNFGVNYLQIMQCWGDDPAGPDRKQCQYGGSYTQITPGAGTWVRTRQVNYAGLLDRDEPLKQPAGSFDNVFVPFWPAGKDEPSGASNSATNDFFDSQITNEIPLARTHADHTGEEFFEIQTVRQAAGLGCGDPVTTGGTTTGRSCWLVVVPRGTKEVDGTTRDPSIGSGQLVSSPLSMSNWNNRIVFPLTFLPAVQTCPIGSAERRIIGHELVTDAVGRWQPALCGSGGALYSYTQLSDDVGRNQVLNGSSPGLALMTNPIPPDQVLPGHPLVYAPVGLSGLAIAFNIEHQPVRDQDQQLSGRRFTAMKLTPRLVAKLLTQSYRGSVQLPSLDYLKDNAKGLTVDPEFLEINPDYEKFAKLTTPPDALVQLDGSDLTSLLWSWVVADPDASAFLKGAPDPYGMVINPNNKDLTLPASNFPRNDQTCIDVNVGTGINAPLCTQDAHPFTSDMHDSGRSASRGDSQARTIVLGGDNHTPVPKKVDRQLPGQRALLAVVDTATAARYGLPTAALRNAAKQFVAPTNESLLASEAAMKPSPVAGVLASDPSATDPAAYPLTALSYAVTSPSTLDVAAGKDYAAFLRYAAGPGQEPGVGPGQLPIGMVPLPAPLKAQTVAAAVTVETQAGKDPAGTPTSSPTPGATPSPTPGPTPGATPGPTPGATPSPTPSAVAGSTDGPSATPGTGGSATGTNGSATGTGRTATGTNVAPSGAAGQITSSRATQKPGLAQQQVAGVRRTPPLPAPAVGALLLAILICGAFAATSWPVLHSPILRRFSGVTRRELGEGG